MADYDKQYQEDLERAQALSLESLALEEFKNKRLRELNKNATSIQTKNKTTSVTRASSMSETDSSPSMRYERQQSKSRPRPGTSMNNSSNPLIAPPPSSQRKSLSSSDSEDLISFASPPANTSNTASSIIDFCNQQSYNTNNQLAISPMIQQHPQQAYHFKYWSQMPLPQPPVGANLLSTISQSPNFYNSSGSRVGVGFSSPVQAIGYPEIGFKSHLFQMPGVSPERFANPQPQVKSETPPPALPPKNQVRQPPPLSLTPKNITKSPLPEQLKPHNTPGSHYNYINKNSVDPNKSRGSSIHNSSISSLDKSRNSSVSESNGAARSHNLIDFAAVDDKSVRVSILQEFDPILSEAQSNARTISPDYSGEDTASVCGSVYDEYNDYDFIYTGSGNNSVSGNTNMSEPIYATVNKMVTESTPMSPAPPVPPRTHRMSTIDRRESRHNLKKSLLDDIVRSDQRAVTDPNLKAFYNMVYQVRNQYKYNEPDTNMGLVISPMVHFKYNEGLSIKLRVHPDFAGAEFDKPISFTCDVNSSVEHITMQLTCDLDAPQNQNYTLKVYGFNEYLVPTTFLSDYEYVHTCIKLDEDVVLILIPDSMKDKSFARTMQDDCRDKDLTFEKVVPTDLVLHITYDNLKILLETVESEMKKIEETALQIEENNTMAVLQPLKVIQSVKCIINLMGDLCTLDIIQTIDALIQVCKESIPMNNISFSEIVKNRCNKIRLAIQSLIEMYSQAFTVNFEVINNICTERKLSTGHSKKLSSQLKSFSVCDFTSEAVRFLNCPIILLLKCLSNLKYLSTAPKCVSEVLDSVVVRVCAIYRPNVKWEHDSYTICGQIYHGTRKIGRPILTQESVKIERDQLWPSRIIFDSWLEFQDIPISNLARESRLVLQIFGKTLETTESEESKNSNMPVYKEEEVGWTAIQFFNYEGTMVQGSYLLSVWPNEPNNINDHMYGPAPSMGTHPQSNHPMIGIEIVAPPKVQFPVVESELLKNVIRGDFNSLDNETQELLIDACDQDLLYRFPPEIRESPEDVLCKQTKRRQELNTTDFYLLAPIPILWEKRHYMYHLPKALPKVLLAAHSWAYMCLPDLHGMIHSWKKLEPIEALQLLLPVYPDMEVRKISLKWIRYLPTDELIDYLPQLVVALRYETYEHSALAEFLLHRALRAPRFAHHLFWLLSHNLPGSIPQNGVSEIKEDISVSEVRHHRRMRLLLRALLAICGESLRKCFLSQQLLVKQLNESAENVQKSKDSHKLTNLHRDLEHINSYLSDNPTSLPLSPTLRVNGVEVKSCSYFPSNTLPLKINFIMEDSSVYPAIHKVGDDLQQDMLTLQIIRLMDKLWLQQGLDLKMVAFNCIPTSKRKGMIEMVTKAETLRKIQVEHGLTGSFKDKPIAEWLAKHNPSELEYGRAVQNFTASCAGYCVVTYVMGICDRHNDNIMLKTSGHLFHIDFGKFLGDAQMFGNFKRDRAPFVLTSDMAYVINGGDRPTEKFHQFVDLCCQAFNIIRNNRNLFLFLMTSSGICSITPESISYMHKALLPEMSNPEAAAHFTRLIEESLKTKFTQFNFFLHNLAQNLTQLKFTADNNSASTLSFVPKTYSMTTDGRLTHVQVAGYRKRYDPDKYYVYVLHIYREDQLEPMEIQRTYKEFCELHQKLCMNFPLAKLYSLSTGLHMGRQNIKQVAHKRLNEISLFIKSLFLCATEIAHSDLVYTFFHPLLRDQQEDEYTREIKDKSAFPNESGRLKGQLKLSLLYSKGVFTVMVHHARGLPKLNGQEPSTYVKVYLQPDVQKSTKRKTKVVKKNCHPSFMEMLEYRMVLEIVRSRTLKATVWNYDPLQENEFMGGVELELASLDLTTETTEWYPLVNLSR